MKWASLTMGSDGALSQSLLLCRFYRYPHESTFEAGVIILVTKQLYVNSCHILLAHEFIASQCGLKELTVLATTKINSTMVNACLNRKWQPFFNDNCYKRHLRICRIWVKTATKSEGNNDPEIPPFFDLEIFFDQSYGRSCLILSLRARPKVITYNSNRWFLFSNLK